MCSARDCWDKAMGSSTSTTTTNDENNNDHTITCTTTTNIINNNNSSSKPEICAICLDDLDDELGPSKLVVRGIGAEIEAEIGARSALEPRHCRIET